MSRSDFDGLGVFVQASGLPPWKPSTALEQRNEERRAEVSIFAVRFGSDVNQSDSV
jgi:hypothetical protein